jgi:hypothetical protein
MPISHSQVQKDEAKVSVPMYGDTLNIVYYPSRMTDEVFIKWSEIQDVKSLDDAKGALVNINEMLSNMIKSWDYFEDDDQTKMWPLEPDRMAELDMTFKMKCLFAMMRHVRPEAEVPQIPT